MTQNWCIEPTSSDPAPALYCRLPLLYRHISPSLSDLQLPPLLVIYSTLQAYLAKPFWSPAPTTTGDILYSTGISRQAFLISSSRHYWWYTLLYKHISPSLSDLQLPPLLVIYSTLQAYLAKPFWSPAPSITGDILYSTGNSHHVMRMSSSIGILTTHIFKLQDSTSAQLL